jgi:hypothetical protein
VRRAAQAGGQAADEPQGVTRPTKSR